MLFVDDLVFFSVIDYLLFVNGLLIYLTFDLIYQSEWFSFKYNFPLIDDGHSGTELFHIIHNMGGQYDYCILPYLAEQLVELIPFLRIQSSCGFIHNEQSWIGE